MSNPNFVPTMSSDEIWHGTNNDVCLTDVVDGKAEADHTHSGYAPTQHTHDGYAPSDHTHAGFAAEGHSHSEYAPVSHTHNGYAAENHTHTGFAAEGHTHSEYAPNSALQALETEVDGKAAASHTHDYAASNHGHSYNDLSDKPNIPEAYSHPASHPASMITGLAEVATTGDYDDLANKPTIPVIPASLPADGGNADTVDNMHASDFAPASHTHDYAETDHTHTPASIGAAAETHSHTGYADSEHTHDYAAVEHTHEVFSGASASTYKLVYLATDGSDDNDGFSTTTPMATIKGVIRKYAGKYKMLDIRLADGTYTEDIGTIAVDACNLSIRSISQDKDKVTINMANQIDSSVTLLRMYNMTLNVTVTGMRPISVNGGNLYAYGLRINVPEASTVSCVNVYNGCAAFLMDCILNSGTASNSGAAVYGNQAHSIKAINCTSERKVRVGVHAHNGTDIIYTDTINATTKAKETSWGKCTLRT